MTMFSAQNLTDDQIQQLEDAGVDPARIAQLQNKSQNARDDYGRAADGISRGGGVVANGLYLPDVGGTIAQGIRGYAAKKSGDQADAEINGRLDNIARARAMGQSVGVLGRNADPGMAAAGMDAQGNIDESGMPLQDKPDLSSLSDMNSEQLQTIARILRQPKKPTSPTPTRTAAQTPPHQLSPDEFLQGE